jgi:hypothetical protein
VLGRPIEVMRLLAASVLFASSVAIASPRHDLAALLRRAPAVALVTLAGRDSPPAHGVMVRKKMAYRGAVPRALHLRIDPVELPDGADLYLAVAQGDKVFGPPTDDAQLGQGIAGQRGYQGWLLYPVRRVRGHDVIDPSLLTMRDGEVRVDELAALLGKHPYREAGE